MASRLPHLDALVVHQMTNRDLVVPSVIRSLRQACAAGEGEEVGPLVARLPRRLACVLVEVVAAGVPSQN